MSKRLLILSFLMLAAIWLVTPDTNYARYHTIEMILPLSQELLIIWLRKHQIIRILGIKILFLAKSAFRNNGLITECLPGLLKLFYLKHLVGEFPTSNFGHSEVVKPSFPDWQSKTIQITVLVCGCLSPMEAPVNSILF